MSDGPRLHASDDDDDDINLQLVTSPQSIEITTEEHENLDGRREERVYDRDPECVCGETQCCCLWCTQDNYGGMHDGHCPCCCCCKIRCIHVPETVCLTLCSFVCLGSLSTTFATWFMVAATRNVLAGFFFMLMLIVYIPVLLIAHFLERRGKSSRFTTYFAGSKDRGQSRFRRIANLMYSILFLMFLIFSVFVTLPEVYNLPSKMDVLGDSSFASFPKTHSFSSWMFKSLAVWGPYESHNGNFNSFTVTYKTGFPTNPPFDDCEVGSRSYKPYLNMRVHQPTSSNPVPIIFHIHGGGWTTGNHDSSGWSFGYFLDQGFGIVSIQYRYACHGYSAFDMYDDIEDAFNFVVSNADTWNFNASRFHFVGGSAGGHLATWSAYKLNRSSIKSVYNLYGVSDWTDFMDCEDQGTSTSYTGGLKFILANKSCTDSAFKAISPLYQISEHTPVTVSYHGTLDSLVPYKQSERLHSRLDQYNIPNVLVRVSTFDHVPELGYHGIPAYMHRYAFMRLLNLDQWDVE